MVRLVLMVKGRHQQRHVVITEEHLTIRHDLLGHCHLVNWSSLAQKEEHSLEDQMAEPWDYRSGLVDPVLLRKVQHSIQRKFEMQQVP
jgi:hypothetical protein